MGSKNDRHLGGSLGGVLGPRDRAHGQQPAENEAWGGVGEGLRPSQEAWELGLFKELFVLLLTAGDLHALRHKALAD